MRIKVVKLNNRHTIRNAQRKLKMPVVCDLAYQNLAVVLQVLYSKYIHMHIIFIFKQENNLPSSNILAVCILKYLYYELIRMYKLFIVKIQLCFRCRWRCRW